VAGLEAAADGAAVDDAGADDAAVFLEVAEAEAAFWEMAR
jgi:formylaminopyrimidine deformylase / aminopyrimidine aminohydrolase